MMQQFLFFGATIVIGIGAGLSALGFHLGAKWIFNEGLVAASLLPFSLFSLIALLLMVGGAWIAGILMDRFAPDAPGSGIPQVKMAYAEKSFNFSWNLLWVKFFGGMLTIGTGSSLGREGPTVHIGAALGSKIAKGVHESQDAIANATCAGAAAGLAAAFNSPLAGVTLVLEEIAESQNMDKYAGRTLLASAIAVSTIYLITGNFATLPLDKIIPLKWEVFWLSPLTAIFAGLIGIFFQWATLNLLQIFRNSKIPHSFRPATGAWIACFFCLLTFFLTSRLGAFGLGTEDLKAVLNHQIVWQTAGILLLTKLIATIFCYGSGGCGGIFAPLIFLGGMAGAVVYGFTGELFHLNGEDQILLSLIGMTAALASVVRAPLTSIIIVMEMTQQFHVLPALMGSAVIAVFINRLFFKDNFYNASLKLFSN